MPDAPRRVPTDVERAAAAVEAGHAWRHTANSRPGYATWPNTQPGGPSWWRHDIPGGSGSSEAQQAIADVLAANELNMVPRDPNLPPLHWRDITGLPEPRRRWWHRLTRRAR